MPGIVTAASDNSSGPARYDLEVHSFAHPKEDPKEERCRPG
ncbi:hypothetical protein [Streptomyces sp. NBC_01435]|nr:hypothetical protein [Streptomyces sp. NBC_01435]